MSARNGIWPGVFCKLVELPDGTLIAVDADAIWHHPWWIEARYETDPDDAKKLAWVAYIEDGFVNGEDVTIATARSGDVEFIALTDEESAGLKLLFRDPLQGGGYPPFFETLGVKPASSQPAADFSTDELPTTDDGAIADPTRTREIRAADIVLTVPRYSTTQNVTVADPFVTADILNISTFIDTSIIDATKDAPYRLQAFSDWIAPKEPSLIDRLLGTAAEPQTDQLLIGTIYMVSPENAGSDAVPDDTWTVFGKSEVFWHLLYDQRRDVTTVQSQPVQFHTLLGAGLLDGIAQGLLAPINDAYNALDQLLEQTDLSGKFWSI